MRQCQISHHLLVDCIYGPGNRPTSCTSTTSSIQTTQVGGGGCQAKQGIVLPVPYDDLPRCRSDMDPTYTSATSCLTRMGEGPP